jgi:hypothetical protein
VNKLGKISEDVYPLNQREFDKLLGWLDSDRDLAGEKYEAIRRGLIKMFVRRGCPTAEELADETIDKVCQKLVEIADNYIGDPALFFYGVAKNIYREWLKRKIAPLTSAKRPVSGRGVAVPVLRTLPGEAR